MKIAYVASAPVPSRVARSVNIVKSCAALAALGHQVVLLLTEAHADEVEPGVDDVFAFYDVPRSFEIRWLPTPRRFGGRTLFSLAVAGFALRWRPDLVYGRYLRACLLTCRLGFDTVVELHSPVRGRRSSKARRLIALARLRHFRAFVTLTDAMRRHFVMLGLPGIGEHNVLHAPTGAAAPPATTEPQPLPRATSGWQIGYAGGLDEHKGAMIAVQLAKALPGHDFHLMGGSEEQLATWRAQHRLPNLHLHGYVPQAVLLRYIAALDLCLLPNQPNPANPGAEPYTSPLKLFNYMALGRPVLASDYPELREILNPDNAVLVDDPTRVGSWVAAIEGLAPDRLARIGAQARHDFIAHYTLEARYRDILQRI